MSEADSLDASRIKGYENVLSQYEQDQSTANDTLDRSRLADETDNSLDVSQLETRPTRKKARISAASVSDSLRHIRSDARPGP